MKAKKIMYIIFYVLAIVFNIKSLIVMNIDFLIVGFLSLIVGLIFELRYWFQNKLNSIEEAIENKVISKQNENIPNQ